MPESLNQFARLLTDSGLMSVDQLEAFRDASEPGKRAQAPDELARQLVDREILTEYQLGVLTSDDPQPLVFGDYAVLDRIGAGGMGVVYRAEHRRMKRIVALKTLPDSMVNDAVALRRFEREVELAAKLSHPNVVSALDAREEKGVHYLIMEFVEGRDLTALVEADGPQAPERAIDLVAQIARGCAHAHSLGVIHRDIKPSNVLINSKDVVKILDMGLARLEFASGDALAVTQSQLTGAGVIMGTLDYISPEQALNAHRVDHRTDIYSLGCTLFYLLTGQAIYGGDTAMEKLVAHREEEIPPLQDFVDGISERLDSVYRKMVAKRPDNRYQSMDEVIEALEHLPATLAEDDEEDFRVPAPLLAPPIITAEIVTAEVLPAPMPGGTVPHSLDAATTPAQPVAEPRPAGSPFGGVLILIGRILGGVVSGFTGYNIGMLAGFFGVVPAVVLSIWFGSRCGGGLAAVVANRLGMSDIPPESIGGAVFRRDRLRHLAILASIGALAGWRTGDVGRGVLIALAVAAVVAHRRQRRVARQK